MSKHQYTTEVYDNNYLSDLVVRLATENDLAHGKATTYNANDIPHLDKAQYTFIDGVNGRDQKTGVWVYKDSLAPTDIQAVAYIHCNGANNHLAIRVSAQTAEL